MEALKAVDPYQIDHLVTANLEYYKFIGKKECRLYDCMGKLICSGTCNEKDECEMYFASNSITIESSQIIYVKDN